MQPLGIDPGDCSPVGITVLRLLLLNFVIGGCKPSDVIRNSKANSILLLLQEICELLIPAITAPSNTPPAAIDHLILTACSTPDPESRLTPDNNYGELIRCFANTR